MKVSPTNKKMKKKERKTLSRYGHMRVRDVLLKRRGEAGVLGPTDAIIVQPTSIGVGVEAMFMEVRPPPHTHTPISTHQWLWWWCWCW